MRTYNLTTVVVTGFLSAAVALCGAIIYMNKIGDLATETIETLKENKDIAEASQYLTCLENRTTELIGLDGQLKTMGMGINFGQLRKNYDHATGVFAVDKLEYVQTAVADRVGILRRLLDAHEGPKEAVPTVTSYATLDEVLNPPVTEYIVKKESCESQDKFEF